MKLPEEFLHKMQELLDEEEMQEFLASYQQPRLYGLRVNTLKVGIEEFLRISPMELSPIPWTRDGFYYPAGENPGRHPYYHAGLYYIQEPSAMLPAEVLDAQPGERVLDLCAAPGGKSVQIAAGMKGEGLLVSNDISPDRVKALVKNIELCGVRNAIVTNDKPENLSKRFNSFFDKVLVDAPCSGEGMFRKDEDAAKSWGKFKCETCAGMQREILEGAHVMLKPGGRFVYSTCTFSPEEDERMIAEFMDRHPEYTLLPITKIAGIEGGRPEWAANRREMENAARLWPHRVKGEGHFVALLQKGEAVPFDNKGIEEKISGAEERYFQSKAKSPSGKSCDLGTVLEAFRSFARENLQIDIQGHFLLQGANLYCLPELPPDLNGIRVAKFGWYLGEYKNQRFEPSHSLALSLNRQDVNNTIDFSTGDRGVSSYLKGETLMIEGAKGLVAVCVDGYILGWARQTGDMLKNLYPKGWRKMG